MKVMHDHATMVFFSKSPHKLLQQHFPTTRQFNADISANIDFSMISFLQNHNNGDDILRLSPNKHEKEIKC